MSEIALITGGTSGIGLELAKLFAHDKHPLVIVARGGERLEKTAADLRKQFNVSVDTIGIDLGQPGAAEKCFDEIKKRNLHPTYLINNAGFGDLGLFVESPLDRITSMIQLNVLALTQLTRLCLPFLVLQKQGRILNVASTAAFQPGPLMAVYYATKAYVLSFSEALREELQGTGVTVTILCPGPTKSGFQKAANMEDSKLVQGGNVMDSPTVARMGYDALKKGRGILVTGFMNKVMAASVRFTPRSVITKVVRRMQERVH